MSKFIEIAQRAIREAETVECSLEEFADGLGEMIDELSERHTLVIDEVRDRNA